MPSSMEERSPQHGSVGDWEPRLQRYLLLLASLAATVTYAAGLDPPGGSWVESDSEMMAVAGDSILRATHHRRYLAFYYSNATAFAASLVVMVLLLLLADKKSTPRDTVPSDLLWRQTTHLSVLRLVMVLDLLALMVAYTAGSCRDKVATIYTAALVASLSAYVGIHILMAIHDKDKDNDKDKDEDEDEDDTDNVSGAPELEQERVRKVLMLLAIFAATITYNAGLNPPGGFWEHTDGLHRPGEVVLKHKHGGRFAVFFFCNTTAFIASLFTVVLLLDKRLTAGVNIWPQHHLNLYGFTVVTTLVTLVAAYAAGSCRKTATTTYTVALVAAVLVSIFLAVLAAYIAMLFMKGPQAESGERGNNSNNEEPAVAEPQQQAMRQQQKRSSLVLLLATLAASITYEAGLNPPGGVWLENQSGHKAGDPILSYTDPKRYTIFFYCNSTALVASIVVILMVQIKSLLKRQKTLHVVMILDLLGLLAAYIAGSSRTLRASVYIIALAAAFLVYGIGIYLHAKKNPRTNREEQPQNDPTPTATSTTTSPPPPTTNINSEEPQNLTPTTAETSTTTPRTPPTNSQNCDAESLEKRRKRLLLCAILMAAITYQAGLSPPGGFWRGEQGHSSVGSPILEDMYPRRYKAFFYCNAMSFMASIALIILLQDNKTYQQGIRFYGLYGCMLVGMLVLMGAYAAGTARKVKTSIYVFVLVGGVIGFIAVLFALFLQRSRNEAHRNNNDDHHHRSQSTASTNANGGDTAENNDQRHCREQHTTRKYVMLLAMLAASVTYQAGLDPPGGVWPDGYAAGSPVLHDSNLRRYHVFFYSNSSSFVASIVIIIFLLQSQWLNMMQRNKRQKMLLMATNIVVALDLIGLLVAYAAGSCRTLESSWYVIVLVVAVVIYIVVFVMLPDAVNPGTRETTTSNTQAGSREQRRNGANGQHP